MTTRNRSRDLNRIDCTFGRDRFWSSSDFPWDHHYPATDITILEGGTEEMDDVVTPSYEKKSKQGQIVNNEMIQTKTYSRKTAVTGSCYCYEHVSGDASHWVRDTITGHLGEDLITGAFNWSDTDLEIPVGPSVSDVTALAVTKLLGKLSEPPFQAFVTVAEADKTISFARDTLVKALGILRDVRKLRLRILAKKYKKRMTAAKVAKLWLEYRYAIRPLIGEIQGAIKATKCLLGTSKPKRARFSACEVNDREIDKTYARQTVIGGVQSISLEAELYYRKSQRIKVTAGCLVEYEPGYETASAAELFGVRNEDVLPAAWDLVPYSFLVDYFMNTASYFKSWSPRVGSKIVARWVKAETAVIDALQVGDWEVRNTNEPAWVTDSKGADFDGGAYTYYNVYTHRYPDFDRPLMPRFDVRLSPAVVADIIALFGDFKDLHLR